MDQIRGLAIFLVVAFHAATILTRFLPGGEDAIPTALRAGLDFFAPYRMPTLMFLSGTLLSRSLSKSTASFFWGKIRGIGWPYLLWTVLLLVTVAEFRASTIVRIPYASPTYLWYLQFLLFYYLLAWIITRPQLRWMPMWLPLTLGVIGSYGPDSLRFSRFCYLFVFFWLGYLVSKNWRGIQRLNRASEPVALGLTLVAIAFGALRIFMDTSYAAWALPGPLALCALVVGWGARFSVLRSVAFIGEQSLVYYVTHFAVIWVTYWWLSPVLTNAWALWSVGVVVAIGVATLFALLRKQGSFAWAFQFPRPSRRPIDQSSMPPFDSDSCPLGARVRLPVADKLE